MGSGGRRRGRSPAVIVRGEKEVPPAYSEEGRRA